jgi:hypothetical protein
MLRRHHCHASAVGGHGVRPRRCSWSGLIRFGSRLPVEETRRSPWPVARLPDRRAAVPIQAFRRPAARRPAARGCFGRVDALRAGPSAAGARADHHHHLPRETNRHQQRCHRGIRPHRRRGPPRDLPADDPSHPRVHGADQAARHARLPGGHLRGVRGRRVGPAGVGPAVHGPHPTRRGRDSTARRDRLLPRDLRQPRRPSRSRRPSHAARGCHGCHVCHGGAVRHGVREPDGLRRAAVAELLPVWGGVVRRPPCGLPQCRDRRPARPSRWWWPGGSEGGVAAGRGGSGPVRQPGEAAALRPAWHQGSQPGRPKGLFRMS